MQSHQFSSVQSLSRVLLFVTPWIAAHEASLSITNSWSSLRLTPIESVMPSSHLILRRPLLLLPQSLPASESFPMSQLFAWDGQSTWEQIDQDTKETATDFYFCEFQNHCIVTEAMKLKDTCFLEEKLWPTQTTYATRDITLLAKVHIIKVWFFPVVVHGCEIWTIKKDESQLIDVLKLWCWRRLLSPLNCKQIKGVSPKGNQHWLLIGRTDAEVAIFWPPDAKSQIIRKDTNAG